MRNIDNEDDDLIAPKLILTPEEILFTGLRLVNYPVSHIHRVKNRSTNTTRFKGHFGCNQYVAAAIFEDLQISATDEARLDENKISIKYFLQSLHFLYVYDVERR